MFFGEYKFITSWPYLPNNGSHGFNAIRIGPALEYISLVAVEDVLSFFVFFMNRSSKK